MIAALLRLKPHLETPRVRATCAAITAVLAMVILILCLLPGSDLPKVNLSDKIEHLIAYAALSVPLGIALGGQRLWQTLILSVAYGAFVEIAQGLANTGRSASWLDASANAAGAALGTGLLALLFIRTRTKV